MGGWSGRPLPCRQIGPEQGMKTPGPADVDVPLPIVAFDGEISLDPPIGLAAERVGE